MPVAVISTGILSGKTVVAVAAGYRHSLALCSNGTVVAWGHNFFGQLGNNSISTSSMPVPVRTTGVLSDKLVVAVSGAESHSLALCSDGTVAAWGANLEGQLGNNGTTDSRVPVAVDTSGVLSGNPVTAVSAGVHHSLALAVGLSNVSTLSGLTLSAGSVSPYFASGTYTYTASVSNATTSMTVTPDVTDSTATVKVNGTAVASGTASQSIPLAVGSTTVQIEVTSQDGTTISTYTLTITRALSSVATLSELSLSSGTLSPGFAPVTRAYTASVANATTSMTVTPTATDSTATVQVNGTSITSGTASQLIPLAVGNNTVQIRVTAQNGLPMLTYTLTITRAASSVATLSGLSLSSCSINPGFAPETPTYTASVANATTSTTVTPTVTDSTATVHVNGTAVASGTVSQSIPLAVGNNTLHVKVIAEDGTTSSIYMLTITRAPSAVATLSDLSMSGGFLDQGFSPSVTSYTSSVENTVTSINVKPTLTDLTANAKVNEEFVNSGSLSAPIQLVVGTNTVQIEVAAQDGTTIRNYTLTITRAPSSVATLAGLWLSASNLSPGFSPSEFAYTASVENSVTSVKITPATSDSTAKVKVNGTLVASGMSSGSIPLEVGTNTITTLVTAQDGTSVKTYTIKVTRAKSPDATLSGLLVKTATISPKFKPGTTRYTASVPFTTLSVKIKATASHGAAKIRINGRPVKSGTLSAAIPLEIGKNLIKVVVTAQNGSIKTYKITAVRARFLTAPKRPESLAPTMTKSPEGSTVSKLILDGRTYLQLTTRRNTGAPKPVIEVSPNLVDWFSGARHTTTLVDDGQILRVRDNTPATPGAKRYIRASGD